MGCSFSRQSRAEDKVAITDPSKIDLTKLSRTERFEITLPITLTDVEVFFKSVKAI
jgi:hypothetical protein